MDVGMKGQPTSFFIEGFNLSKPNEINKTVADFRLIWTAVILCRRFAPQWTLTKLAHFEMFDAEGEGEPAAGLDLFARERKTHDACLRFWEVTRSAG